MKNLKRILLMLLYFMLAKSNYIDAQFACTQPNNDTPVKFIKVHIHFIRDDNGNGTFSEADGKIAAKKIIADANKKLTNTQPPNLKVNGIQILAKPTKYRYVLYSLLNDPNDPDRDGIYFHNNSSYDDFDEIYPSNSSVPYSLYGSGQAENIYNIYFVHRNNDSSDAGFAEGFSGRYTIMSTKKTTANGVTDWGAESSQINHEMGHNPYIILGILVMMMVVMILQSTIIVGMEMIQKKVLVQVVAIPLINCQIT